MKKHKIPVTIDNFLVAFDSTEVELESVVSLVILLADVVEVSIGWLNLVGSFLQPQTPQVESESGILLPQYPHLVESLTRPT
mgnify:CR=1 FL=1